MHAQSLMKRKWVSVAMTMALSLGAMATPDLIAGYDSWMAVADGNTNTPSQVDLAASGRLTYGATWSRAGVGEGCIDGTFGTVAGASTDTSTALSGSIRVAGAGSYFIDVQVTNDRSPEIELGGFHFDAWRAWNGAPQIWSLEVLPGGSIPAGAVGGGVLENKGASPAGGAADYDDLDVSLPGFKLSFGETAVFRLTLGGATAGAYTYIDNVAVTGTAKPPVEERGVSLLIIRSL